MRCTVGSRNLKHFSKILINFSKLGDEVRWVCTSEKLRIEGIKNNNAFGVITIETEFFDHFDGQETIDIKFKSKSMQLIFRKGDYLEKQLIKMEIMVRPGDDKASFKLHMRRYFRSVEIPVLTPLRLFELDFGSYNLYPVQINSNCKLLFDQINNFHSNVHLVTFRLRNRNTKVETGDEEHVAQFHTHFYMFVDEFKSYKVEEEVDVTFDIKLFRSFLNCWDKKNQIIECYFSNNSGLVFVAKNYGFIARIMLARVNREYQCNSPPTTQEPSSRSTSGVITYRSTSITGGSRIRADQLSDGDNFMMPDLPTSMNGTRARSSATQTTRSNQDENHDDNMMSEVSIPNRLNGHHPDRSRESFSINGGHQHQQGNDLSRGSINPEDEDQFDEDGVDSVLAQFSNDVLTGARILAPDDAENRDVDQFDSDPEMDDAVSQMNIQPLDRSITQQVVNPVNGLPTIPDHSINTTRSSSQSTNFEYDASLYDIPLDEDFIQRSRALFGLHDEEEPSYDKLSYSGSEVDTFNFDDEIEYTI